MSMPNIPAVSPTINLNRSQVVNLLLASIAFEELGLAHLINAEAEKVQAVVGTLPGVSLTATSISQLLSVNRSVNRTLQTILKTQMLLQFKLEDVLGVAGQDTPPIPPPPPPPPLVCPANILLDAAQNILPVNSTTLLSGKVTDADGDPLPNIQVILTTDAGTVASSTLLTDAAGDFSTVFTAPGSPGGVVAFAVVAGTTIVAISNLIVV